MSIFRSLEKTKASGTNPNGDYFPPGYEGEVTITAVRLVESQKGNGTFLAVDVELVTTNLDDWLQPGQAGSIMLKLDDKWGFGLADTKSLLMAATHSPESEITEAMAEEAVSDAQPLAGLPIVVRTATVLTKAKEERTKHFFDVSPNSPLAPAPLG
jgi:hypothetical protein